MDDVAIIDVLRDAAELLSLGALAATTEANRRYLADAAAECMDAAVALAARHLSATPGGR